MPYSDILRQGNFTFEEQGLLKINNSKVIVRYVTVFAAGWAVIAYLLDDHQLLFAALIAFFGFLGGIILHEVKYHLVARVVWVLAANMAIFTASLVTLQEADMNFIFLVTLTIPFVIFRPDEHRNWLTGLVGLAACLWIVTQVPGFHSLVDVELDAETAKAILSPAASFTTFGVVLFVVGYFTQKSEAQLKTIRASNAELVAADRAKTRLLTSLSHEMRTPLHAIHGYTDLMRMDLSALDPALLQQARSYPGQILRSCRSLLRILDNMFTFVTWADREYRPELEQATASDLVEQVLSEFNEDVTEKKLQIATSLPHTLAFSTDPKMLVLALRQLIDNAIKFTPEGGQIMISGDLRGDTIVEIVITDSGQGFPKGTAEQAFNPFERLSYEASSTPGVGMGLSLARAAMQRINGRVLIDQSESGAKVRLELPPSAWPPSIQ